MSPGDRSEIRACLVDFNDRLNATGDDGRAAVIAAWSCLARLDDAPEDAAAAQKLTETMDALRRLLKQHSVQPHNPVLPPLHPALAEGWMLPLDQLRALGVGVRGSLRSLKPRVHSNSSGSGGGRSR